MSSAGRFFAGAALCALGFVAILFFLNHPELAPGPLSRSLEEGGADLGTPDEKPADSGAASIAPAVSASAIAENSGLRTNDAGIAIITESEGLSLEAYQLNGQWLIGYGHAATARPGMRITEAEARTLLRQDLRATEAALKQILAVRVNENEFSAMVSLAYNLGLGGFRRTAVFERINEGDRPGAADGFLQHDRARINGVLTPLAHLTERREKERALFLTPAS